MKIIKQNQPKIVIFTAVKYCSIFVWACFRYVCQILFVCISVHCGDCVSTELAANSVWKFCLKYD